VLSLDGKQMFDAVQSQPLADDPELLGVNVARELFKNQREFGVPE
jgi:hypothetical protein